jgi:hypothetical protein
VGFDLSNAGLKQQAHAQDNWRKWSHRDFPVYLLLGVSRSADAALHRGLPWAVSVILAAM